MRSDADNLKYPIGKFQVSPYSGEQRKICLNDIKHLPSQLEYAILNLDEAQLEMPYREGGWSIRQLVHHVADSHINALCRLKLVLTEDNPAIRPYDQEQWALTAEYSDLPVNMSLTLLHALHAKLHCLFAAVEEDQWERTYYHPETKQQYTLWYLLGNYAWHGKHHVAHINGWRERMGW